TVVGVELPELDLDGVTAEHEGADAVDVEDVVAHGAGVEGRGPAELHPAVGHDAGEAAGRRWGRGIHSPAEVGRSRIGVAGGVGRLDLEAVAAVGEAAVALRTRAGGKSAAVEAALEAGAGLAGAEAEAGAGAVRRIGWALADRRLRRSGVDDPVAARRRRV